MIISEGESFPMNLSQHALACFFFLVGSVIQAVVLGVVVDNLSQANEKTRKLYTIYDQYITVLSKMRFPVNKRRLILSFLYGSTISSIQH